VPRPGNGTSPGERNANREDGIIPQTLATAKIEVKDGFIVAACDPAAGAAWDSEDGQRLRGGFRRLTHVIVLGLAVVPASITLAWAHPQTQPPTRLRLGEPPAALVSAVVVKEAVQPVVPPPPPPPPPPAPEPPPPPAVAEAAATPPQSGGTRGQFPWGWCTWYVSSRRTVAWSGNANEWYWAARSQGLAVGSTPRVGAIMVSRESAYGHVAYVESVSGNSFTISEMNFHGFGVVSQRRLSLGQVSLVGFIY
jgi:hypothetical protein